MVTTPTVDLGLLNDAEYVSAVSGGMLDLEQDAHAAALRRVAGWVRTYCRWHVFPEITETLTLDGTGGSTLHLPSLRVVDVHGVNETTSAGWSSVTVTWSAAGMLRKRSGCFTDEFRGVEVVLTHGHAEPHDLLGVIVGAAVRHSTAPDGNTLSKVGDISYQSSGAGAAGGSAFLQSEYAVLDHYRLNSEV